MINKPYMWIRNNNVSDMLIVNVITFACEFQLKSHFNIRHAIVMKSERPPKLCILSVLLPASGIQNQNTRSFSYALEVGNLIRLFLVFNHMYAVL